MSPRDFFLLLPEAKASHGHPELPRRTLPSPGQWFNKHPLTGAEEERDVVKNAPSLVVNGSRSVEWDRPRTEKQGTSKSSTRRREGAGVAETWGSEKGATHCPGHWGKLPGEVALS